MGGVSNSESKLELIRNPHVYTDLRAILKGNTGLLDLE